MNRGRDRTLVGAGVLYAACFLLAVALLLVPCVTAHADGADDAAATDAALASSPDDATLDAASIPSAPVTVLRVTYYVDRGLTYSGTYTGPGTAACSWNLPAGTQLLFVLDGRAVTCLDRGLLGWSGWVDIWQPSLAAGRANVAGVYGDYTGVVVTRWGWGD